MMTESEIQDCSKTSIYSMTEKEYANYLRQEGGHTLAHQGRYWMASYPGFYRPVHWMARLEPEEATRPRKLSWGFQSTLCDDGAPLANSYLPVYHFPGLNEFDPNALSSNRRYHLRKCLKTVKIVQLNGTHLLRDQGYEIMLSATKRIGIEKIPSKDTFLSRLSNHQNMRRLYIAGLIDKNLGGFLTGYAVDGVAYIESVMIATEALRTHIGTGLYFEFIQICRRSRDINELINGLHSRENKTLSVFKEGMGFEVKAVPSIIHINPILSRIIQWRFPDKYYRLHGHD